MLVNLSASCQYASLEIVLKLFLIGPMGPFVWLNKRIMSSVVWKHEKSFLSKANVDDLQVPEFKKNVCASLVFFLLSSEKDPKRVGTNEISLVYQFSLIRNFNLVRIKSVILLLFFFYKPLKGWISLTKSAKFWQVSWNKKKNDIQYLTEIKFKCFYSLRSNS